MCCAVIPTPVESRTRVHYKEAQIFGLNPGLKVSTKCFFFFEQADGDIQKRMKQITVAGDDLGAETGESALVVGRLRTDS